MPGPQNRMAPQAQQALKGRAHLQSPQPSPVERSGFAPTYRNNVSRCPGPRGPLRVPHATTTVVGQSSQKFGSGQEGTPSATEALPAQGFWYCRHTRCHLVTSCRTRAPRVLTRGRSDTPSIPYGTLLVPVPIVPLAATTLTATARTPAQLTRPVVDVPGNGWRRVKIGKSGCG